jgi:hypothetical protein
LQGCIGLLNKPINQTLLHFLRYLAWLATAVRFGLQGLVMGQTLPQIENPLPGNLETFGDFLDGFPRFDSSIQRIPNPLPQIHRKGFHADLPWP